MFKLILLMFATTAATTTLSPNHDVQPFVVAPCDVIKRSGVTCRDCNTLSRCVLINNIWESFDVDTCDSSQGLYCNSIEERCSDSPGSCNRLVDFVCAEEGSFPNPFTCQEYYICLQVDTNLITPFQRFCESGTAYSATTQACTLNLNNPVCLRLQWECNYPGDLGLWPGSDDIFYICQRNSVTNVLYPVLHKCINDQVFDGTNCVARQATTTEILTTTTDQVVDN